MTDDDLRGLVEQSMQQLEGEPARGWIDQRTPNDCWLACIASLTGLRVEDMPQPPNNIERLASGKEPSSGDYAAERAYLHSVGRWLLDHGWAICRLGKEWAPRGYSIASGPSPRNPHFWHSVVYRDGVLAHDPHASREGIITVEEYEVLVPSVYTEPSESSEPVQEGMPTLGSSTLPHPTSPEPSGLRYIVTRISGVSVDPLGRYVSEGDYDALLSQAKRLAARLRETEGGAG